MITWNTGKVAKILRETGRLQELEVEFQDEKVEKAIHYKDWMGRIGVDDTVLLNTTAMSLSLGSGGFHFVIVGWEKDGKLHMNENPVFAGHIMKLRYTPYQFAVQSAEENASPYHQSFLEIDENILQGVPILVGELHSMLPGICLSLGYLAKKEGKKMPKICYIMSDGGALPFYYSRSVSRLQDQGFLHSSITIGHAFGGDLECVNIYSALHGAKSILEADIIVITPGPGVVGTGTPLGFSGMEQVSFLQAVSILGGKAIFIPRISFADPRERHRGISHHSLTILRFAREIPLVLNIENNLHLLKQFEQPSPLHEVKWVEREEEKWLQMPADYLTQLTTMGRNFNEDTAFFLHTFYASYNGWKKLNQLI